MAANELEREARKRRERRDSGCAHECKERRNLSEERSPPPPHPPPLHDYNRLESERRAERLSRARRPQVAKRRISTRPAQLSNTPCGRAFRPPKENGGSVRVEETPCSASELYDCTVKQRSQCESASDKPVIQDEGALSPGAYVVAEECPQMGVECVRRLERSAAPHQSQRRDQPSPERRLDKICKKINILKKNISKHEEEFEAQNGRAMSPCERITDVPFAKMLNTLRRLQAEKKLINSDPVEYALQVQAAKQQKERERRLEEALKSDTPMGDVVRHIEEWLEGCRHLGGRAGVPESSWSAAQLAAEKSCFQRVLLRLEASRGRPPAHSAERGAARPLYDRYRAVKRALANARPDSVIHGGSSELATILEHETMLFTSVDSSSDSQDRPPDCEQEEKQGTPLTSPPNQEVEELVSSASSLHSGGSEEKPTNEGLHCLSLEELSKALQEAKLTKYILRRTIKEYEVTFEKQNNRKAQKDDKKGQEQDYVRYKDIKARIKLLNALINKQKAPT